jgi:hypothetical protein
VPTGGLAHLHGVAHDPDGDALSYSWSLDACQEPFLAAAAGPMPTSVSWSRPRSRLAPCA